MWSGSPNVLEEHGLPRRKPLITQSWRALILGLYHHSSEPFWYSIMGSDLVNRSEHVYSIGTGNQLLRPDCPHWRPFVLSGEARELVKSCGRNLITGRLLVVLTLHQLAVHEFCTLTDQSDESRVPLSCATSPWAASMSLKGKPIIGRVTRLSAGGGGGTRSVHWSFSGNQPVLGLRLEPSPPS